MKKFASLSLIVAIQAAIAFAQEGELFSKPRLLIPPVVKVQAAEVKLGDIARISEGEKEFAQLVSALKGLQLETIAIPGSSINILGADILSRIDALGISRDSIGYSIPRSVRVERAGRVLQKDELLEAARVALWADKSSELQIRDLQWSYDQMIAVGRTEIRIERLGKPSAGNVPARAEVFVDGAPQARFLVTLLTDDWKEIPVVTRSVERGMLISNEDVAMVRVNLSEHPTDVVTKPTDLFGMRTKVNLNPGDAIRRNTIDMPPVITKGKKVSVIYQKGPLRAVLMGTAVEDGFSDGMIKVRNESSKKIVTGRVRNSEEVEVLTQ